MPRGEKLAAMRLVQVHALDRVLEHLELQQPGSAEASAARDAFNVDRRIERRSAELALDLPTWAGGYDHTVPAALALLATLQAHAAVPADVAAHIRMLASLASGGFGGRASIDAAGSDGHLVQPP